MTNPSPPHPGSGQAQAPREVHLYFDGDTADVVVVFPLGSGRLATKLRGAAVLGYTHDHRTGGAAPAVDTVRLDLTFRDAAESTAGRHRRSPVTDAITTGLHA